MSEKFARVLLENHTSGSITGVLAEVSDYESGDSNTLMGLDREDAIAECLVWLGHAHDWDASNLAVYVRDEDDE